MSIVKTDTVKRTFCVIISQVFLISKGFFILLNSHDNMSNISSISSDCINIAKILLKYHM